MAIHTEQSWKRHSNPWSVWTRILSYPLAYVPVLNRCWKQGALVGAWFTANPVIFPAPEDDSSWATRCVLGEQLWTAKRRRDFSGCVLRRCAPCGLQAAILAFDVLWGHLVPAEAVVPRQDDLLL